MYQSLKANKYQIFEAMKDERGRLVEQASRDNKLFGDLKRSEKSDYRKKLIEVDKKIEQALTQYRNELESELSRIHAGRAKLRKQSNVKNYHGTGYGKQGNFIDKLK